MCFTCGGGREPLGRVCTIPSRSTPTKRGSGVVVLRFSNLTFFSRRVGIGPAFFAHKSNGRSPDRRSQEGRGYNRINRDDRGIHQRERQGQFAAGLLVFSCRRCLRRHRSFLEKNKHAWVSPNKNDEVPSSMESSPSSELKFEDKDSNVSDVIKTFQLGREVPA